MTNREILFRGKRIDNGDWVYGLLLANKLGAYIITEENPHECTQYGYIEIDEYSRVDPKTVGQYTGLKDKNGVKIFEGDALKVINPNDEEDNLCVVKWDNLCGGYPYVPWGGFGNFDVSTVGWAMTMEFTFEIIGNIHDNPELLEV